MEKNSLRFLRELRVAELKNKNKLLNAETATT